MSYLSVYIHKYSDIHISVISVTLMNTKTETIRLRKRKLE